MARQNRETNFIGELKRAVRYYFPDGSFWYKIPDDNRHRKPFDVIAAMNGRHFALEMKVHVKHTAWPLNDVKEHQIEGLKKAALGGYISWIMLNVRLGAGNGHRNFVRILSLRDYNDWQESSRKSIPVDELEKCNCIYKTRIEEIGEALWKINGLFL